jgi:hypothetical protein
LRIPTLLRLTRFGLVLIGLGAAVRPVRAEVPLEQALGIYQATAEERRELSPLWGLVALKSGLLAKIRRFGNYTSTPAPGLPPHPQLDPRDNCPQDAIAAVVQYLFPSPDGIYLVHNEYRGDPIGLAAREAVLDRHGPGGLRRIGKLLEAAVAYRKALVRGFPAPVAGLETAYGPSRALAEAAKAFEEDVTGILDRKGSRVGHLRGTRFPAIRADFARLLQQALLLEATGQDRRYPPDTVEVALLAYAWQVADQVGELREAFPGLLPGSAPDGKARFDRDFFEQHRPAFLERLEGKAAGALSPEDAALFLAGERAYRSPTCELITYRYITWHGYLFPDCGESALRNLLNIALSTHGELDPERIEAFLVRMRDLARAGGGAGPGLETKAGAPVAAALAVSLDNLKRLERYYTAEHPRLAGHATEPAHWDWNKVVAGLNVARDRLPIDYEGKVIIEGRTVPCNLRGTGLPTMLDLVAHLVPDPLLNRPWPGDPAARNGLAAEKLTRLCALLSIGGRTFDWSVDGGKTLADAFPRLDFTLDGQAAFTWKFDPGHVLMMPVQADAFGAMAARIAGRAWEPWLDLWVRPYDGKAVAGAGPKVHLRVRHPADLFGYQLDSEEEAARVLRGILEAGDEDLGPSFQLIAGRSLSLQVEPLEKLGSIMKDHPEAARDRRFYPIPGILARPQAERDQLLLRLMRPSGVTSDNAMGVLADHGADVRQLKDGEPLVCLAATRREAGTLAKLLAAGAGADTRDSRGRTPLGCAVSVTGAAVPVQAIAELLIQAKADLEAADGEGATPLALAAEYADPEVVQLLLRAHAKVDAPDQEGRTPLMRALIYGDRLPVVQALVQAGADLRACDHHGASVLDHAARDVGCASLAWLQKVIARREARETQGAGPSRGPGGPEAPAP